jgi:protein tyrosine phosphatase (PTP) superfamily phosphohydrolase (DUF442 family)
MYQIMRPPLSFAAMTTTFDAIAGVANACQALPQVLTGGQPNAQQLAALKAAGGTLVLDIRDPMEPRPLDEPATLRNLGLAYVNIPVGPGTLNDATLERILGVLRGHRDGTLFFHCGSGNRVGGALIPHLMLDHGMEEEDAVAMAMRAGLRSAEYLEWGLEYTQRKQQGE